MRNIIMNQIEAVLKNYIIIIIYIINQTLNFIFNIVTIYIYIILYFNNN